MWKQLAFLMIVVPLALLGFVVLLLSFGRMPKTDLTAALTGAILVAAVFVPSGITIWVFALLTAGRRRGRRDRP